MENYILLLKEIGIDITDEIPKPEHLILKPDIIEKEYEYWDWGDHVLRDLNEPGCVHPFAIEYHDEIRLNHECKIHRYSRIDRFRFTVLQLLGFNGAVPLKVIEIVKLEIGKYVHSCSKIWNTIRKILKENGFRKYYNRIPKIISIVAGFQLSGVSKSNIDSLFEKFQKMSYLFNTKLRTKWKRSYFPNLRYIALRMISEIGITFPYHVPLVRTFRKKKYLNDMYNEF